MTGIYFSWWWDLGQCGIERPLGRGGGIEGGGGEGQSRAVIQIFGGKEEIGGTKIETKEYRKKEQGTKRET